MATHDKNAAQTKEIDAWVDRIEEITGALDDFLKSDPAEEDRRRAERTAARKKAAEDAATQRVRERYDSQRYKKFEDDAWIASMLEACDKAPAPAHQRHTDLTPFERVTLREAEEEKARGNAAMGSGRPADAYRHYSNGIGMMPCDEDLLAILHNNRAQAALTLHSTPRHRTASNNNNNSSTNTPTPTAASPTEAADAAVAIGGARLLEVAAEDASFVLARQRHNAKALLRRASAFSLLYRPTEAAEDLRRLLIAEPRNAEALKLRARVEEELTEYAALEAFKKAEEDAKKSGKAGKGAADDEETNVERMSSLCESLVGRVGPLADALFAIVSPPPPPPPASSAAAADDEDAIAGVGAPSAVAQQTTVSPPHVEVPPADDKATEVLLKAFVDDLCEVGGILALHGGSALLFRAKGGLFAVCDVLSLLATAISAFPSPSSTAFAATLGFQPRHASPFALLMLPMAVVALTCGYRVLSLAFPSPTSRRILVKDVLLSSMTTSSSEAAAGNQSDADGEARRPLLTAVSSSSPSSLDASVAARITVAPLRMLGTAVAALSTAAPGALQSALASSATLRSAAPWAMQAIVAAKKGTAGPPAASLAALSAYQPLHAACADFVAAVAKEESGWALGYLFAGGGAMQPPLWSVGGLGALITHATASAQQGKGPAAAGSTATLAALLRLCQRAMVHTAEILSPDRAVAASAEEAAEGSGAVAVGPAPSATTSALALMESKGVLTAAVVPACLAALEAANSQKSGATSVSSSSSSSDRYQQQLLQEAALEAILVVPPRCYRSGGSNGNGSNGDSGASALVRGVLKALLPATFGVFAAAATEVIDKAEKGPAKTSVVVDAEALSRLERRLGSLSYNAEASLAIVYNALLQASATVEASSSSTDAVSERAALVAALQTHTQLYPIISTFLTVFSPSPSVTSSTSSSSAFVSPTRAAVQRLIARQHTNVVARCMAVVDRTASASGAMAAAMRGESDNKNGASVAAMPSVMAPLWRLVALVSEVEEENKKKKEAAAKNGAGASSSVEATGAKGGYGAAALEHASVLMAALFFHQSPSVFQREFDGSTTVHARAEAKVSASAGGLTSSSHQQEEEAPSSAPSDASLCATGEDRLSLLLSHLRFSGSYSTASVSTATPTNNSANTNSSAPSSAAVMQYASNAVFLGNVALLLGRVPSSALVECRPTTSSPSSSSDAAAADDASASSVAMTIAGTLYVAVDGIKLGIDAIVGIRSAVQALERDLSAASKGSKGAAKASAEEEAVRKQIRHLRGAQKNLATMVSRWLTAASSSPSSSEPLRKAQEEAVARLTSRLRDIKGFEVLAISLKETS